MNLKPIPLVATLFTAALCHAQVQLGEDLLGTAASSLMGQAVAVSADGAVIACGAAGDNTAGNFAGAVRVFTWDGISWNLRGDALLGEAINDFSGTSVSLNADGTVLAIGAQNNDGNGPESGHARVYAWDGDAWAQRGADIDGEATNDMAFSVSLSDDGATIAVGAAMNNGGGIQSGHARVFTWNGNAWVQKGADIDGAADSQYLGRALSLSGDGDRIALGAGGASSLGTNTGMVQVMDWNGASWELVGEPINGVAANDVFGISVDLSADGSTVACGAYLNDDAGFNAGHVRVFTWSGSTWEQQGITLVGEQGQNNFGYSVGLSGNGDRLAVGALYYNGTFQGEGRVYMHEWSGTHWVMLGPASGEQVDDYLGHAVALSGDGGTVVAGALGNDQGGTDAGSVRVFCHPPTLNAPLDTLACDAFTLPPLTNGNYFTEAGGSGTLLEAGTLLTEPMTVYAYAPGAHCTAESAFEVSLATTPAAEIELDGVFLNCPTPAQAYQWFDCDAGAPIADATASVFTATVNGNYAVIVTNAMCSDTSDCVAVLSTGAEGMDLDLDVRIHVDAASGTVRIVYPNAPTGLVMHIRDAMGRMIAPPRGIDPVGTKCVLPAPGVYVLTLLTPDGRSWSRSVVRP